MQYTILGRYWHKTVVSVFLFRHPKCHLLAHENGHFKTKFPVQMQVGGSWFWILGPLGQSHRALMVIIVKQRDLSRVQSQISPSSKTRSAITSKIASLPFCLSFYHHHNHHHHHLRHQHHHHVIIIINMATSKARLHHCHSFNLSELSWWRWCTMYYFTEGK